MSLPLEDTSVIDCGQVVAGPLCGAFLADLGADVLKVEPPENGELLRSGWQELDGETFVEHFELVNRNKSAITLDVKDPDGRALLGELLAAADVFLQNWQPGVAKRLDLDWETLHERYPDLIYTHITGYGKGGPLSNYPGMDTIAQHVSGYSSMLGFEGDPPIRSQTSVADVFAAYAAFSSTLGALYHRDVNYGGGQRVDVSLLESLCHHLDGAFELYNNAGEVPPRGGRNHFTQPDMLYGSAEAKDGWICVALLLFSDRVWDAYCDLLDRPDLHEDPKYDDADGRMEDAAKLSALFEEWLADYTGEEAIAILNEAGIPASEHLTVDEAAEHEHMAALELFRTIDHPRFEELTLTASPLSLSETGIAEPTHAPVLGQDVDRVLADLGYDEAEIAALREAGVV